MIWLTADFTRRPLSHLASQWYLWRYAGVGKHVNISSRILGTEARQRHRRMVGICSIQSIAD